MSIFYDDVPGNVDASAIVEVTIIAFVDTNRSGYLVGTAKVERVIKGDINSDTIRVLTGIGDCLPKFPVGTRGIVIGNIRRDEQGVIELMAIPEPFYLKRQKRFGWQK